MISAYIFEGTVLCSTCKKNVEVDSGFLPCCGALAEIEILSIPLVKGRKKVRREIKARHRRLLTREEKLQLYEDQKGRCFYCLTPIFFVKKGVHVDHFKPFVNHGNLDISNLHLTCTKCNLRKGSREFNSYEEAVDYLNIKSLLAGS